MASPYTNIKFSDAAMPRIAQAAGYSATPYNKEGFQQFLAQNPDAKAKYEQFQQQAVGTMMAARGGVVKFVDGGMVRKYAEGGDTEQQQQQSLQDTQQQQQSLISNIPAGLAIYNSPPPLSDKGAPIGTVPPLPGPENDPLIAPAPVGPPTYTSPPRDPKTGDIITPLPYPTPDFPEPIIEPTPEPTPEPTIEEKELERLGSISEDQRTEEENARLEELRAKVPFTFNGETIDGTEAKNRFDYINRKREDLITDADRDFLNQYRARYGYTPLPAPEEPPAPPPYDLGEIEKQRLEGGVPESGRVSAALTEQTPGQDIAAGTGQAGTTYLAQPSQTGATTAAQAPTTTPAAQVTAAESADAVAQAGAEAAQSQFDQQIIAAQQNESSVSQAQAAQGTATLINSPANREIQAGELISPAANAEKASAYAEQIQAATASPTDKATVQGQLTELYSDFDAKDPPAWAAGAMRAANAAMAARGLSASSLAGQAVIQATMEAAVPIAQADASVFAQFEAQNLSNRQQRAMLAAQQRAQFIGQEFDQAFQARVANSARIADIANMNFNAEQQVILENSRAANTMNLSNLNNRQAVVMAEAAALSQLDMANLSNRQQAAVQSAQNFLQVDMANLSNRQQTAMFNAQSRVHSRLSDTAAQNAARQFNASSENQTNQFFASLGAQISQFNAAQSNAMQQFNIGQENSINQFNANLLNQREQFNAQNALVVSQSNVQWRRQIATQDLAATNRANEFNATAALGVSNQAYSNIQQFYRDTMFKAIESQENALDRETRIATAILQANNAKDIANINADASSDGSILKTIGDIGSTVAKIFF